MRNGARERDRETDGEDRQTDGGQACSLGTGT